MVRAIATAVIRNGARELPEASAALVETAEIATLAGGKLISEAARLRLAEFTTRALHNGHQPHFNSHALRRYVKGVADPDLGGKLPVVHLEDTVQAALAKPAGTLTSELSGIVAGTSDSIVHVQKLYRTPGTPDLKVGATGFFVKEDLVAVTQHQIEGHASKRFILRTKQGASFEARVVAEDPEVDIALLKIVKPHSGILSGYDIIKLTGRPLNRQPDGYYLSTKTGATFRLGELNGRPGQTLFEVEGMGPEHFALSSRIKPLPIETSVPAINEKVVTIGYPLHSKVQVVSPGVVTAHEASLSGKVLTKVNQRVAQGDSGAPVFNMEGRVVGIHSRSPKTGNLAEAYFAPADRIKRLMATV